MGGNGVCPCELFMEYEGMGRTNVGKGYTQMLLREKRDVKVMAKEVCTNAPSAPVTATAPHRWLKTIENKFADALRIPSLCRYPHAVAMIEDLCDVCDDKYGQGPISCFVITKLTACQL